MSRSSAHKGQVEPTAALAATLAVVVGIGLYAGALVAVAPDAAERDIATPTLDRVHRAVTPSSVVVTPRAVRSAPNAGPSGYRTNVTVRTAERRWSAGPEPPPDAKGASRSVSVRLGGGRIRAGTLRVEVWP